MQPVFTIMRLTFREAWRRKVVLLSLVLSILYLALYSIGFGYVTGRALAGNSHGLMVSEVQNTLLLAGLYVVHFLTVVLSIFVCGDTISGEISTHTIQSLATKPISRWQIIIGKWLGYSILMGLYITIVGGGLIAITWLKFQYLPSSPITALSLLLLESQVLICLTLFAGTRLSTITNGVTLFLIYSLAFIGSWVEQIGSTFNSPEAVRVGVISSLLLPVEALWRRTSYTLQPADVSPTHFTPFSAFSVPSVAMIWYAGAYALVALGLSIWNFKRTDL